MPPGMFAGAEPGSAPLTVQTSGDIRRLDVTHQRAAVHPPAPGGAEIAQQQQQQQ